MIPGHIPAPAADDFRSAHSPVERTHLAREHARRTTIAAVVPTVSMRLTWCTGNDRFLLLSELGTELRGPPSGLGVTIEVRASWGLEPHPLRATLGRHYGGLGGRR